ncbi:sulfotransferase family protein [Zhongshania marina]|uniref:Sulfotransferase n=1 Tax=Zhongshania marina TaxID=2304603 RepID=A0ABX9W987_9GAMM|nr:sulfotransferase [Zhongshania marina]
MKRPVNANFPAADEDHALLSDIADLPLRPVLIMGLHRSGTTFLYDCVSKSFPVAHLSLYHLLYFDRLLSNKANDKEQEDKDLLNRYFLSRGISDRNIDGTHIDADAVEEYGFLLRKKSGTFKLADKNAALFTHLCKKLLAVQNDTHAVLLKNPWDTGNAKTILKHAPEARFIYISREPIAVLNSMLNALLSYLEGPQDYLEILLDNGRGRSSYRTGYIAWLLLRGVRKLIGRNNCARLFRRLLAKDVARQVAVYKAEIASLPKNRAIEIDYRTLVADPAATMRSLQALLDLPIKQNQDVIEVKSSGRLNPILMNYEAVLNKFVSKAEIRL